MPTILDTSSAAAAAVQLAWSKTCTAGNTAFGLESNGAVFITASRSLILQTGISEVSGYPQEG